MRTGGNDNLACRTLGKGEHEEMDCTIYKGKDKHACRMFGEKKKRKKKRERVKLMRRWIIRTMRKDYHACSMIGEEEREGSEEINYPNYENILPCLQNAR